MIVDGPTRGGAKIRAARSKNGPFTIDPCVINASRVKELWFDPRCGYAYFIHRTTNAFFHTHVSTTSGMGNDWILILEDKIVNFPTP